MTNEDAIKYHRENYQSFVETLWDGNEENNPYDEAFRMAISALESIDKIKAERDAAVSDLVMCMYFSKKNNNVCNFCKKDMAEYPNKCAGWSDSCECNPEWRGISKEES